MPFGERDPLPVPGGTHYETCDTVESVNFNEDDDGTYIVLHFAPVQARSRSIRAPITREIYEAYAAR